MKHLLFKAIAVILSMALFLLCTEVVLRIFGPDHWSLPNISKEYYTNPRGYHGLLREEEGRAVYGLIANMSVEGYRLPDDGSTKTADISGTDNMILGLGDSFTFGRGVKYDDLYLAILRKTLNEGGYNCEIHNCARIGANVADVFSIYKHVSSHTKYKLVIYGFVPNDFIPAGADEIIGHDFIDFDNRSFRLSYFRERSKLYDFISSLIEKKRLTSVTRLRYLDAYKDSGAEDGFRIIKQLNRDIKESGGRLSIVLFPLLHDFKKYYFIDINEKMKSFCENEGIEILDLLPAFSQYSAEDLWVNPADHHPNEIANKIASEEIYRFMKASGLLDTLSRYSGTTE
ncbi:MAG: SGNH/GDSL hydrolase family protein [Candidatus Omnitrophota bacterium]